MDSIFNFDSWTFSSEYCEKIQRIFAPKENSRNIVSIDGDWYVVTLPFRNIWEDIERAGLFSSESQEHNPWMERSLLTSMHLVMDLPRGPSEQFFRVYFNLPHCGIVFNCNKDKISWKARRVNIDTSLNGASSFLTTGPSVFGWRPMLIPLNRNMEIDLKTLRSNPNGSIMEGGSFFFRDEIYSPETNVLLDAAKMRKQDRFCLGDTQPGTPPLKWICWNGLLYCACNLAHISCENIHGRGLIFG